jgi:beta-glucosidase
VRARLGNLSDRAGDEVVQLYVRPRVARTVNGKRLVAYRRLHLAARESVMVELAVPAAQLSVLDAHDRWVLEPGVYEVMLGTSSQQGLSATFELSPTRAAARNAP